MKKVKIKNGKTSLEKLGITAEEYEQAEKVLLNIDVEYYDWLRCKGTTPLVYTGIIKAMIDYKNTHTVDKEMINYTKSRELTHKMNDGYIPNTPELMETFTKEQLADKLNDRLCNLQACREHRDRLKERLSSQPTLKPQYNAEDDFEAYSDDYFDAIGEFPPKQKNKTLIL